ncbi:hypothetical protein HK098_000966 [Nowakowskiella sp. JEL0407]|nr:hypothetical protein HK098_000966 [Nowakowskiella sp. JEL0407]
MKAISKVGDVIMTSRDIQTEINPEELIQLRKVTKTLEASSEDQKRLNALAIEERVLKYQAELDVRLTKEMKEQLEQFKQVELATMRFEERQKYQVQIVQIQQDAEKRILQEKGKAIESQEAAKTLLEEQKKELDRQNIQLRQSLLDEGNKTIMAEKQLRNEAELNSKRAEMERDLAQRKYDEATKQINELQNYKERYERVMQEKMAQYKIDLNKEYAGSLSSVEVEKTKIEAERQILVERAKSAENTLAQALAIQKESAALRESLRDTRAELDDVRRERDDALNDIKELKLQVQSQRTSTAVEFEIQSLKTQLLEAERMNEKRQEEYQLLLKSFMTPKDETQKELAKARRMEENWKKECQQLVLKLDMEFSRSEQIERKYQDEVLKTKELRREVADLRRILHETQTALTSELSRRNTELGGVRYTIPNNNIQDTIVYSPDLSHFKPSEDNVNPTQCPPQEISESPMANKFTDIKIARHTRIPDPMMHLNEFRTPLQLNKRENLTAPLFHPPQDEESTNVDKNQEFSALVQFKPDVTFNQATNPMPKNNGSLVSNINTQTTPTSTKMITPQYKTDPSTTTPSVAENRNDAISDVANNTEYISKDGNSQKSIEMKSNPPKISPVDTSSPANVDIKPPSKVEDVEKETEVDEVVMDLAQLKLQREMRLREEERERMRVLREKQALEEGAEKDISSQKVTEMIEKKVDDVVVKDAKVEKENLDFKDDPLLQKYMEIVKEKREKEALVSSSVLHLARIGV